MGKLSKVAKQIDEVVKDLNFLHNTSAERLTRFDEMGGLPVPSLAVTKQDIPFDEFGDITLIGKPKAFDPRSSATNKIFSADAYTARSPSPIRVASKDASERFKSLYPDEGYTIPYALEQLSSKRGLREGDYSDVIRFFESSRPATKKFIQDNNIKLPKDIDPESYQVNSYISENYGDLKRSWAKEQVDELFEPGEFFISNPNRDYYTTSPNLKPYNADEITSYMRRNAGKNTEGGMSSSGFGAQRASTAEQYKSLAQTRQNKGNLAPRESIEALKDGQSQEFFSLADELKPYYKYDANGFTYLDEMSDLIKMSESRGIDSAFREIGFENVPDDVVERITSYKDSLRNAPTQYFEAKPTRKVELDEFGGAIVPANTPADTLQLLERRGIPYEKYADEAEKTALRKKFSDLAFTPAPVVGATGLTGLGLMGSDEASAGSILPENTPNVGQYMSAPRNEFANRVYNVMSRINRRLENRGLSVIEKDWLEEYLYKATYDPDKVTWGDRVKAAADIVL